MQCGDCEKPARWVRRTQFAGDHHFCEDCAKQQEDFGKSDPSSFVWEQIKKTKSTKSAAPPNPRKAFERIITDVMRTVSEGHDVDIDDVVEKCMNVRSVDLLTKQNQTLAADRDTLAAALSAISDMLDGVIEGGTAEESGRAIFDTAQQAWSKASRGTHSPNEWWKEFADAYFKETLGMAEHKLARIRRIVEE